jgi:hypothetical protein
MSRFPPLVRDALAQLAAHGLTGNVEPGPHFKVRFVDHHGRKRLLVISKSPSDRGAAKKNRSQLRRLLRWPN